MTIPEKLPDLMRLDPATDKALRNIETLDYKVTLARLDGLPSNAHYWVRENSFAVDKNGRSNDGLPVLISSNQDTKVFQIYQFTETGKSSEELETILRKQLQEMDLSLDKVIAEEMYTYFPHFTLDAFRSGAVQRIIDHQGRRGIYLTGASMNFETVELAAQHAKHVVNTYF